MVGREIAQFVLSLFSQFPLTSTDLALQSPVYSFAESSRETRIRKDRETDEVERGTQGRFEAERETKVWTRVNSVNSEGMESSLYTRQSRSITPAPLYYRILQILFCRSPSVRFERMNRKSMAALSFPDGARVV